MLTLVDGLEPEQVCCRRSGGSGALSRPEESCQVIGIGLEGPLPDIVALDAGFALQDLPCQF